MTAPEKDTIYVDIDDEITTIIDKVHSSDARIVALVLPKRATVFQSIVNMKLLKRAADVAKKRVVLVTSEASLMPLAGAVGLYVAPTPQSKPEIPAPAEPAGKDDIDDALVEEPDEEYTADNAGNRPVGELAGKSTAGAAAAETVALDDEDEAATEAHAKHKKPGKNRHLTVPNFNKFRLRLFLGVFLVILIIVGLVFAATVLPKAKITIATNASTVNVNLAATLDTAAQSLDTTKAVIPAKSEQQQKTTSQQVNTTGQKNNGDAATGSVSFSAQACAPHLGTPDPIASGTGVSTNGLTFITQEKAVFGFDHFSSGSCAIYKTGSVDMTAQTGGTKYNVTGVTMSVAGRADVTGTGSASGGTDDVIQIVAQADIDGAKQKLATADTTAIKATLEQALRQDGMYPLPATFNAGTPVITTSANAGDTADSVTVTQAVTYTMLGAKQADLDNLIKQNIDTQIDAKNQSIQDDGLTSAAIAVTSTTATAQQITLQTTATVGPDISVAEIKKEAAGKKIGDVKAMVNTIPGVTSVDVELSPFWVSTVPMNPDKVTVTIGQTKQPANGN